MNRASQAQKPWGTLRIEGRGLPALAVALDHALRGTGFNVSRVGALVTPKGILKNALLVEGRGERHLVVWAESPEAALAAETLLPQALSLTPLDGVQVHAYGAPPGPPARLSTLLDTRSVGLEVVFPPHKGEFAVYWPEKGEVLSLSPAAYHLGQWFELIGGREEEALYFFLKHLNFEEYDRSTPPPNFQLSLSTVSGGRAVLSYRKDRGMRLHFPPTTPREEILSYYANLARLLRTEVLSVPRRTRAPSLEWWKEMLRKSEEEELLAIGRVELV